MMDPPSFWLGFISAWLLSIACFVTVTRRKADDDDDDFGGTT